jgi:hypothetical protein
MKPIIKGFTKFINENSERDELSSMGFSDKTNLASVEEITQQIYIMISQDSSLRELEEALKDKVSSLMQEFEEKFEWDEDTFIEAAEDWIDNAQFDGTANGDLVSVAIGEELSNYL